jgi:ribosomal protein S18 acetylase RimI-like enzyme
MPLYLRPALPQDGSFVYELIRQVLYDQLHARFWDPAFRDTLLDMQVKAKCGAYAAAYPRAEHGIIMLDDDAVGRLLVDRSGAFYNLIDIAILPKYQGAGVGTRLILGLCMEAEMMQKSVRLHVSVGNPRAADLYKRLGFRVIEDLQTDMLMERAPGAQTQVIAAP